MRKYPRVTIVILNWNGWKLTLDCLKSLSTINTKGYELGIVIVDNGSTDESVKMLRESTKSITSITSTTSITSKRINIHLIENKTNDGFAEGNNVAIRQIMSDKQNDYVLLLNNDTIVEKNFLSRLVTVAVSDETVGIVGPKIYYYNYGGKKNVIQSAGSRVKLSIGKFPSVETINRPDKQLITKPTAVDCIIGACLLIKTEVINKIGLLESRYFINFEDTDWCLRAKRAGYSVIYVPEAVVWHKVSQSVNQVKPVYYYTRNLFWFENDHAKVLQKIVFFMYYFMMVFPKYFFGYLLVKGDSLLWWNYVKGVIDGVGGIFPKRGSVGFSRGE